MLPWLRTSMLVSLVRFCTSQHWLTLSISWASFLINLCLGPNPDSLSEDQAGQEAGTIIF